MISPRYLAVIDKYLRTVKPWIAIIAVPAARHLSGLLAPPTVSRMLEEGAGDAATAQRMAVEGDTLRTILKLRGMTQKKLAERSGIHRSTVSRYVRGNRPITRSDWGRLLAALQVSRSSWDAVENLVFKLDQDRRRFRRTSKKPLEYGSFDSAADEIREGPPESAGAIDPDKLHDAADGFARIVERSLHQATEVLIDAFRK